MPDKIHIFIDSTINKDVEAQISLNRTIKYQNIYKFSYKKTLSNIQIKSLKKLLGCNQQLQKHHISGSNILIASRSSYKSPWSEKAKQIISNCGFQDSLKIDHLKLYTIGNDKKLANINFNKQKNFKKKKKFRGWLTK